MQDLCNFGDSLEGKDVRLHWLQTVVRLTSQNIHKISAVVYGIFDWIFQNNNYSSFEKNFLLIVAIPVESRDCSAGLSSIFFIKSVASLVH